ncbi:hypothetical protein DTO212C5_6604 [Paecilomyces variotii]|nr:hypothetical protein DTO212C5_6604 [Paecilomyces variotii]KAJ9373985.1 hypothetical protein DTO282E5_1341 [Paecilomyces variotii]
MGPKHSGRAAGLSKQRVRSEPEAWKKLQGFFFCNSLSHDCCRPTRSEQNDKGDNQRGKLPLSLFNLRSVTLPSGTP